MGHCHCIVGQWGVYLPNELLAQTISWFSLNHGEFEIMFHPNTGYMVGGMCIFSYLF